MSYFPGLRGSEDPRYAKAKSELVKKLSSDLKSVNIKKVNLESMRGWISKKLVEMVEIEDEILFDFVMNTLEEIDILEAGEIQVLLTPFMGTAKLSKFVSELWPILESSAASKDGISDELREEFEKFLTSQRIHSSHSKLRN